MLSFFNITRVFQIPEIRYIKKFKESCEKILKENSSQSSPKKLNKYNIGKTRFGGDNPIQSMDRELKKLGWNFEDVLDSYKNINTKLEWKKM